MFLEKLTAQNIYMSDETKIRLTLFHAPNEQPNDILTAHSESQIIEGYVDGGPYDRLRRMAPKTNTSDFVSIDPNNVITDRFYIYMYLPLGSTYSLVFLERKKGQDIHKYNALSKYAIFLSLVAIIMLLLNLLFESNVDVGNFVKATSFYTIDWLSTVVCITVLTYRFVLIYLIFDFFIITIYAICSLFSFVGLQMKRSNAKVDQYKPHNRE